MTFLKTILIILLVYFGLKILFRLAKPYLLRYIAKKAGSHFEKSFGNFANQNQNKPKENEGEISIDKSSSNKQKSKNTVGEYVDYEEVE
ncbi:MAG: hypothetical protein ACI8RP_001724 [Urechidicola sp.]|jgi:hypothetical protein|uniref:DUF4834 family protein n=1 Tax=Candidatus Marifrigoribacter sp. Uisw_064 TaxID=3230970 RepID=UPI003AEEADC2